MSIKKENYCFFTKKTPPSEKTRALLLEEAIKVFSEKGFEGVSVRDICDAVGANVSAIKYHFGGKEGLYRECFQQYGEIRLKSAETILMEPKTLEEFKLRLKMFAEEFIITGLDQMHSTKLVCRELEAENPLIQDIFENTFLKVFSTLRHFFSMASEKKFIRQDLDIEVITSIFFHTLTTSLRHDHIGEKYFNKTLKNKEYQEFYIGQIIAVILKGCEG